MVDVINELSVASKSGETLISKFQSVAEQSLTKKVNLKEKNVNPSAMDKK